MSAKMVHCAENIVQFDLVESKKSLQISNVYPSVLLSLTLICNVIWQGLAIRKCVLLPFVCIREH